MTIMPPYSWNMSSIHVFSMIIKSIKLRGLVETAKKNNLVNLLSCRLK